MKNKANILSILILFFINGCSDDHYQTFTDERDGHSYKVISINGREWMAENLVYQPEKGYKIYNNNNKYKEEYGFLYNWETAMEVCPQDWHLPSDYEWSSLKYSLKNGKKHGIGYLLKEKGTEHWRSGNADSKDSIGFCALPAGEFSQNNFVNMGVSTKFWTSSEHGNNAYTRDLTSESNKLVRDFWNKENFYSVRCIKNDSISLTEKSLGNLNLTAKRLNLDRLVTAFPNCEIEEGMGESETERFKYYEVTRGENGFADFFMYGNNEKKLSRIYLRNYGIADEYGVRFGDSYLQLKKKRPDILFFTEHFHIFAYCKNSKIGYELSRNDYEGVDKEKYYEREIGNFQVGSIIWFDKYIY